MPRLLVFNNISLDGYFADRNGDMSWAHSGYEDPEYRAFISGNAGGGGQLLMGRITYQMMAGYWPTPLALQSDPAVAKGMNDLPKVVASRTLQEVTWNNSRLIQDDLAPAVRKMKTESGDDIVILGSGTIVAQLAAEGLVDDFQLVVNPVVLGGGRTMFEGIPSKVGLRLASTRSFSNGKVVLCYQPAA